MSGVGIPTVLNDTLKSLGKQFLLMFSCTHSLPYGTGIIYIIIYIQLNINYAETAPSWFLFNLRETENYKGKTKEGLADVL